MEFISLILSVLVTAFVFVKLFKKSRDAEILDKIPGPPTLPIVGNLFDLAVRREKVVKGMLGRKEKYGSIYRTWLGPIPVVHISLPEYIEVVLSSSKHTRKGNIYRFLHPWLGTGLLTSSGRKWFDHRKLITPTFHFKILEKFVEVFNENSEVLVKKLHDKAKPGQEFDIYPSITLCALDIICETAMGTKVHAQNNERSTYVSSIYKISELTIERSNKLWLHPDIIYFNLKRGKEYKEHLKVLHGFTERVIKERLQQRKEQKSRWDLKNEENDIGTKKKEAFLDLLLDASEKELSLQLSDVDIREEVDTFMFEGHDTTTAAICWTLHSLGLNPQIQDALAEELDRMFGNDRSRPATMRELGEMKLLERIIKESLRMYPSVAFISRRLDEEIQLGNYTIPAETTVAIDIINLHRSPQLFPNPLKFDPDRFLPDNIQHRHPYSYIPFSAGPRNCIGQKFAFLEEKVVLSTILRNFKVDTVQEPHELTLTNELILRPLEGVKLRLFRRT